MMQKTLREIKRLLEDVRGDVKILNLGPLTYKVERISQLFEGVVRELKTEVKDAE